MSSTRRRVKRTIPTLNKPDSVQPEALRSPKKVLISPITISLILALLLIWKFTAANSTPKPSGKPTVSVAVTSFTGETADTSPFDPSSLLTLVDASDPGTIRNPLPASSLAHKSEPGVSLRRVVDKKIENGLVTLILKDEQTGELSTMTQPFGTNVDVRERDSKDQMLAKTVASAKPLNLAQAELPTQGIESIKTGMTVPTRNPITGQTEFKKVTRTFKRTAYEIVKLELVDRNSGKVVDSLRGTTEHPFFTPDGMVAMGDLKPEMKVITRRGPPLVVKSVTREHHPEGISVYNFEVEGDHTYLVGKAEGGVWVHNTCPPLGLLEGKSANVTQKGLDIVENHLSQLDHAPYNDAMLGRLRDAMANGQKVSGADLSFYTHELSEATMMSRGMSYEAAHTAALSKYGVSPFSVYHPDVISAYPDHFNSNWRRAWGLGQ